MDFLHLDLYKIVVDITVEMLLLVMRVKVKLGLDLK